MTRAHHTAPRAAVLAAALVLSTSYASAQAISQRGFIEARGVGFPEEAAGDDTRVIGDALFRQEVFLRPAGWFQLAAGLDLRANSNDQVEQEWRLDLEDRGRMRPRASMRRLALTLTGGGFTLDVGKQFIRWGRADVIYPTDRFAPRDYLNVIDAELLPVAAVRPSLQVGSETFEAVWAPQLTPSRLPLFDQRWTIAPGAIVVDGGSHIPRQSQYGARWRHTGSRLETAVSFFAGLNHQPDIQARVLPAGAIELRRVHPIIRMYGADIAIPTGWFTLKAEAAYVESPRSTTDEYLLYVVEIERQTGEWLLDVGYAGDVVKVARSPFVFAPDRQMARAFIGRAAYTLNPDSTVVIEAAARKNGKGVFTKVEYSQGFGQHWRLTSTLVGLYGDSDDFFGQYRRNSHAGVALRFTY